MKDNKNTAKKVITLDAQSVDNLNKQLATLKTSGASAHKTDIKRAKALYNIKSLELFKCEGAENFKDWYNRIHDGTVHGITYKTACILVNTYANVWSNKTLSMLPLATACRVASVCKTEEGAKAIEKLITDGKLTAETSQRACDDLLKSEGLKTAKTTESAPSPHSDDSVSEEVKTAFALVNAYLTNNCKDKNILNQWNIILEANK